MARFDLEVAAGTACGLLGPNGAGKSTKLAMLVGPYVPDQARQGSLAIGPATPGVGAAQSPLPRPPIFRTN
ncbi:MAG: ATP-binding cassette domain-containing protein [Pseudomonadota bacterium]